MLLALPAPTLFAVEKSVGEVRPPGFAENRDTSKSESDFEAEEAEARAALGRIVQMPDSAETKEQLKLLHLRADEVSLSYQTMFSALGVS